MLFEQQLNRRASWGSGMTHAVEQENLRSQRSTPGRHHRSSSQCEYENHATAVSVAIAAEESEQMRRQGDLFAERTHARLEEERDRQRAIRAAEAAATHQQLLYCQERAAETRACAEEECAARRRSITKAEGQMISEQLRRMAEAAQEEHDTHEEECSYRRRSIDLAVALAEAERDRRIAAEEEQIAMDAEEEDYKQQAVEANRLRRLAARRRRNPGLYPPMNSASMGSGNNALAIRVTPPSARVSPPPARKSPHSTFRTVSHRK
jgi:hypothetical protein